MESNSCSADDWSDAEAFRFFMLENDSTSHEAKGMPAMILSISKQSTTKSSQMVTLSPPSWFPFSQGAEVSDSSISS